MGRSPSPPRRRDDRRREDRRDRDRDRDRRRQRTRSRSRSLERRRRSPDRRRSPSPRRRRSRSISPIPTSSFAPKPKKTFGERPIVTPADLEGKTPEEQEMLKVMGFCGFDTTKEPVQEEKDIMELEENGLNDDAEPVKMTLEQELEMELKREKENFNKQKPKPRLDYEKVLKKEMSVYETERVRGEYLSMVYDYLMILKPTSVEAERAFSAAGYICSSVRLGV
ncbi:probable ATP-dependent RNA helicase DDX46 [Ostrinia nubilalis]|uniref:probable ATP-dependent RNA helicase DDX46 n=1 Tax=Ostrinia nubilalis TaxID=29057 RepID=UPI0030824968